MANEHHFIFCAVDWAGFANEDISNVVSAIGELSKFNTVADRMQQGFLNQLLLGRAMIHPQGFSSNAAFQKNGQSVIDTSRLYFDGNSQGAIMGGGLTAVAPDFERAVLGVPGMNYSTLLQRSVDFDLYAALLNPAYPTEIDDQLLFATIQLLWDRGEANGYAHHMTDRPLPNTPKHNVLLHVGFGDHQVSDTTAEVEARTIGAFGVRPVLDPGRSPWQRFQLIPPPPGSPFTGLRDRLVGHRAAADRERPDRRHERAAGGEPAEPLRRRSARQRAGDAGARLQKAAFLHQRADRGRLRWRPVLRGHLDRPLGTPRPPANLRHPCRPCRCSSSWSERARSARRSRPCACSRPTSAPPRSSGRTRSGSCSWRSRWATGWAGGSPTATRTCAGSACWR